MATRFSLLSVFAFGLLCVGVLCLAGWNVKLRSELREREVELENVETPKVHTRNKRSQRNESIQSNSGGALYTRWGRSSCREGTDTELVYEGIVGGSHYSHEGGGVEYLCLPRDPQWIEYTDTLEDNMAYIYGAEFDNAHGWFTKMHSDKFNDNDIVCAVCTSTKRRTVLMIPAREECPAGWFPEYKGYLMSGHHGHKGKTSFVCVDQAPEVDPEGYRNDDGVLMYHVQAVCGSLPCPNYVQGRELTCVVCSK